MRSAPTGCLLHISKINGHYLFQYSDADARPLIRQVKHDVPAGVRESILAEFEKILGAEWNRKMRSSAGRAPEMPANYSKDQLASFHDLSRNITRLLIPREILRDISNSSATSLIINTNDPAIPWEIARIGNDFLAQRFPIGKIIPVNDRIVARGRKKPGSIARVLFLADPTGDLPGADEEYRRLSYMFDRDAHFVVDYLVGNDVTLSNIARLADSNSYDIIHYSGHSDFASQTGEGSVLLASGPVSASYLASAIGAEAGPIFFFNSCSSATMGGAGLASGQINGLVGSFLSAGALAFIGAAWPIVDDVAVNIACEFYSQIGKGCGIGTALNRARFSSVATAENLTWAGYTLIGDPELQILDDRTSVTSDAVSDGHMAARLAWSNQRNAAICGFHPACAALGGKQLAPLLVSSECVGSQKLVVRPDAPFASLGDLCGATIAFPPVTGMEFFVWHMLEDAGLPRDQFTIVHLQQSEIVSALRRGRVDAAVVWEPQLAAVLGEGFKTIEPRPQSEADYTVCALCVDPDMREDGATLNDLVSRYYACIDYMRDEYLKLPNLLALHFHVDPKTVIRALSKFTFFSRDDLKDLKLRSKLDRYMTNEQEFMARHSSHLTARIPFIDNLVWENAAEAGLQQLKSDPLPVAIQNSISNTPFIVGRFIGLFC